MQHLGELRIILIQEDSHSRLQQQHVCQTWSRLTGTDIASVNSLFTSSSQFI